MQIIYKYLNLPIGRILLLSDGVVLTGLFFSEQKYLPIMKVDYYKQQDLAIFDQTYSQLTEYLNGDRQKFTIDYCLNGNDFQKKIWSKIADLSYSQVISYKDLANLVAMPKAVRAVANTVARNPLSIIIACHRIIASNGKLTGYAGGLAIKKKLLELERGNIDFPKI